MEFTAHTTAEELREAIQGMLAQRELLEIEADAIHSELTSPGPNGEPPVGVREPLVDAEGFPRGDIDLYNAKNKRRRLAELSNDHKALMKRLELAMHSLHALSPSLSASASAPTAEGEANTHTEASAGPAAQGTDANALKPIAKLDEILTGSPAHAAGILEGDLLLQFGTVTAESESNALSAIARTVGECVNRPVELVLRRADTTLRVSLVPRPWGGRGLLGCHLTPLK